MKWGRGAAKLDLIVKAVASSFRNSITRAQFICVAISQCLGRAKQKIQTIIGTRNALGDKKNSCSFNGGPWIKGLKQCRGVGGPWVRPWRCGLRQIERRGPGRVRDHQFQEIWLMRVCGSKWRGDSLSARSFGLINKLNELTAGCDWNCRMQIDFIGKLELHSTLCSISNNFHF